MHQVGDGANVVQSRRRSAASEAFTGDAVPSGCGRRVSLKRRSSTASAASRKIICVGKHALDRVHDGRQLVQLRAFANIHHQRRALDLGRLPHQLGEAGNQVDRQVVHAVVAQILEGLEHRGFPRAAHAGNNDQLSGQAGIGRGPYASGLTRARFPPLNQFAMRHFLRC